MHYGYGNGITDENDDYYMPPEYLDGFDNVQVMPSSGDYTTTKQHWFDALHQGQMFWSYFGHGNSRVFQSPWEDYDDLTDGLMHDKSPFIIAMACQTARFNIGNLVSQSGSTINVNNCLASRFLLEDADRGAIGFIGASTGCVANSWQWFYPALFDAAFGHRLGMVSEGLHVAKLRYPGTNQYYHYTLIGDPALNFMETTESITQPDLVLKDTHIENLGNGNIKVHVKIRNQAMIDIPHDFTVKCTLESDDPQVVSFIEQTQIVSGIYSVQQKELVFDFFTDYRRPIGLKSESEILPDADFDERTYFNNKLSIDDDFEYIQEGFPALVAEGFCQYTPPLFANSNIIFECSSIDYAGNQNWIANLSTTFQLAAYYNNTDKNYYYVNKNLEGVKHLDESGITVGEFVNYNECGSVPDLLCLADLNGDDNPSVVIIFDYEWNSEYCPSINVYNPNPSSTNIDYYTRFIEGNQLYPEKIAAGDSDGDGRDEIFISYHDFENSGNAMIKKYRLDSNNLLVEDACCSLQGYPKPIMFLSDVSNNGVLDCVVSTNGLLSFLKGTDLSPVSGINSVSIAGNIDALAIGDIDNDGTTEIVFVNDNIYMIDLPASQPTMLFPRPSGFLDVNQCALYDIDGDNLMEIILLNKTRGFIGAYNQAGNKLFRSGNNTSKSYFNIVDLDKDGDIELIFNIDRKEMVACDLDFTEGNRGSIYPQLNQWNNYCYSKPFKGELNPNMTYNWTCDIMLEGDVIVPESTTLNILPGTRIKTRNNAGLVVFGELIANGTSDKPIVFEPDMLYNDEEQFQGIKIVGSETHEISHCNIKKAVSGVYFYDARINRFSNNHIENCEEGLKIALNVKGDAIVEDNIFRDNQNGITLKGLDRLIDELVIRNNSITHKDYSSSNGTGITLIKFGSMISIKDNDIKSNVNGIFAEYTDGVKVAGSLENTSMIENNDKGILLFESSIVIEENKLYNNLRAGIHCTSKSFPELRNNIIFNTDVSNIMCTYGSPYMINGHNDIIQEGSGYQGYCDYDYTDPLDCRGNWWGNSDPIVYEFFPAGDRYFQFYPADPSANHLVDFEQLLCAEAFAEAYGLEQSGQYEEAKDLYKYIIEAWPKSKEASMALDRLKELEKGTPVRSGGYVELQAYYEGKAEYYAEDVEFYMQCRDLAISCDVELGLYEEALLKYQEILENPLNEEDEVFTRINVMYTLMLAEECGSRNILSNLPSSIRMLKPESARAFVKTSSDLLNSLIPFQLRYSLESIIQKYDASNYPNPFNPTTTINYSLKEDCHASLKVYNIRGQLVKTLVDEDMGVGRYSVVWDGKNESSSSVSSGIYFYILEADGKVKKASKMILMK